MELGQAKPTPNYPWKRRPSVMRGSPLQGGVGAAARLVLGLVSRYPPVPCGIGEYTRSLAEALAAIDPRVEVRVYATTEAGTEPYRLGAAKVYPCYERAAADYTGLLKCLEEHGGVDVLHISHEYGIYGDTPAVFQAALEAKKRGLASAAVATLHTVYHPLGLEEGREQRLEAQRWASKLDRVVVHSVLQEHELRSQGFPAEKLELIPHGTPFNPYVGRNPDRLLEEIGIEPAEAPRPRLVTPGFLRPDKGLDTLAEAALLLRRQGVKATFIVAGTPQGRAAELVEKLARQEAEKGVFKLIERYLSREELQKLIAAADAVILPYRDRPGKYSVSGILHDVMLTYRPVIGTRVPRLVELEQYVPEMTCAPGDPGSIVARARLAIEEFNVVERFMRDMYTYAVTTEWRRVARQYLRVYEALSR